MIGKRFALVRWRASEPPRRSPAGAGSPRKGARNTASRTDWRTSQDCHVAQACCALSAIGVTDAIRAARRRLPSYPRHGFSLLTQVEKRKAAKHCAAFLQRAKRRRLMRRALIAVLSHLWACFPRKIESLVVRRASLAGRAESNYRHNVALSGRSGVDYEHHALSGTL
jgi:hypothetical protein